MPHRVLADHIRTLVFAISEHTLPSNEGRGYVLRRLLRRALRYAKKLNYEKPILHQLVDSVIDVLGDHYTHLTDHKDFVKKVIKEEEKSFIATLSSGLILFEGVLDDLSKSSSTTISGEDAFKLYDTYGFPIDLTQLLASEKELSVDMDGFDALLAKQREQSRHSTQAKLKEMANISTEALTDSDLKALSSLPLHLSIYTDQARGGEARLISDPVEKVGMARHHSVTHILHQALKEVLGSHVFQAGSFVDVDRLRFDFPHFSKLKPSEIEAIESKVND
jgi:alanyl-tRNA synthetase